MKQCGLNNIYIVHKRYGEYNFILFLQLEHCTARSAPTHLSLVLEGSQRYTCYLSDAHRTFLLMACIALHLFWIASVWARVRLVYFLRSVRKIVKKRLSSSSCLSVYPSSHPFTWSNLAPPGQVFMKFCISVFFSKTCRENSGFIKIWQEWRVLYMKGKR
jgi:hypothetical protein